MIKLSDSITGILMEMVTLEHYSIDKFPHNWKVFLGKIQIGQLHKPLGDGIGGELGDFTETEIFDKTCELAKIDLDKRQS